MAAIHTVGSRVWVTDAQEGWSKAIVEGVDNGQLVVRLDDSGAVKQVKPEDAPLQNVSSRPVEVRTVCMHKQASVDMIWRLLLAFVRWVVQAALVACKDVCLLIDH